MGTRLLNRMFTSNRMARQKMESNSRKYEPEEYTCYKDNHSTTIERNEKKNRKTISNILDENKIKRHSTLTVA